MASERVRFFPTPAHLREWFATNHETATELWAGFYKKEAGKPSITWPESVDEALCCGWIDGIRKSLDESRYMIRFTPRKPTSIWSVINIKRVAALQRERRMLPAGLKAFEARRENKSGIYAYEQKLVDMPEPYSGRLQKNKTAWKYFQAQSPAVRRRLIWWIVSAKREETRLKRVEELMAYAAKNRPIPLLEREPPKKRGTRFSRPVLAQIRDGLLLKIRAGIEPHRFIGIWAVVVGDRVFVRSWSIKRRSWYRTFLTDPRGAIQIGDREIPVRARPATGERIRDAVDRAYLEKYHTKGWAKYAQDLGRPKSRATTTELRPRAR